VAEKVAAAMKERSGIGPAVDEVIDSLHTFIGSHDHFVEMFTELHDRLGISSFPIGDLDQLGPIVQQLAGSQTDAAGPVSREGSTDSLLSSLDLRLGWAGAAT
jgi:hypothetical protein